MMQTERVLTMTIRARFTQMARFVIASMLAAASSRNVKILKSPVRLSLVQHTETMVDFAITESRYSRPLRDARGYPR